MMTLLRSLGSRHMQRDPLGFWGYIREDTHSIGSVTGVLICWSTISCWEFFNSLSTIKGDLSSSMLNWRGTEGSRQIVYAPGILPIVSTDFGKAFLREIRSHTSGMVEWLNGPEKEQSLASNGLQKGLGVAIVLRKGDLLHLMVLERGNL